MPHKLYHLNVRYSIFLCKFYRYIFLSFSSSNLLLRFACRLMFGLLLKKGLCIKSSLNNIGPMQTKTTLTHGPAIIRYRLTHPRATLVCKRCILRARLMDSIQAARIPL